MYEIEHEMEMWAFGTGILGGHFLMIANLAYANMQLVKEEEKKRGHTSKNIELWWEGPNGVPFLFYWNDTSNQINDKYNTLLFYVFQ